MAWFGERSRGRICLEKKGLLGQHAGLRMGLMAWGLVAVESLARAANGCRRDGAKCASSWGTCKVWLDFQNWASIEVV